MSAQVMSPSARTHTSVPGAPALPQVNLLPPEVRAGRQLGRVKAWLGVALLATVLVGGLIFVWAVFSANRAQADLAQAQELNQSLLAEQKQYSEVSKVLSQLSEATSARTLGMSTEVVWKQYLAAVAATAPMGVSLDTFAVTGATPTVLSVVGNDPLQQPSVGVVNFGGRSLTLPDTSAWLDGLASVEGFADPWFTSAQVTEEDGSVYYQVNGSVQITDSAYAERFAAVTEAN